ncbi:MAG TPA: hypothetical protein VMX97_00005 [Hyphomicrobiaceae bacterium]|nr:hypothetical protein [Hyphomicrobiaceae bacterium]
MTQVNTPGIFFEIMEEEPGLPVRMGGRPSSTYRACLPQSVNDEAGLLQRRLGLKSSIVLNLKQ